MQFQSLMASLVVKSLNNGSCVHIRLICQRFQSEYIENTATVSVEIKLLHRLRLPERIHFKLQAVCTALPDLKPFNSCLRSENLLFFAFY